MSIIEHLIVETYGAFISKHSERLRVTKDDQKICEAPLMHLQSVLITSKGVAISSDAVAECCERGIPVFFCSSLGRAYGSVYSAGLGGTILTRREQLFAYGDERGCDAALAFAAAKIENQAITLRYMAKTRKETDPDVYEQLRQADAQVLDHLSWLDRLPHTTVEDIRERLMAAEGNAAQIYWKAVREVIPSEYGWTARETRGATDPVNSLLNYGYAILYAQIERALVVAGLDPYAGFIHADRPGKPSLVCDLIEEFRQVVVDRVVFGLVNRRFRVDQDESGHMTPEVCRTFAERVLANLNTGVRHQGKNYPLRMVIQMQARCLAAFLRRERPTYEAFKASW